MTPTDLDADVLVIGGGLAGLRAALTARTAGASVAILAKGKVGRSGSSAITTWGYAAVLDGERDSVDRHVEDTLRGGAMLPDPRLVRVLAEESPLRLREVEEMGGTFEVADGARWLAPTGDHSVARTAVGASKMGTDFTVPLADRAKAAGVTFVEDALAAELLRSGEAVAGAACLDLQAHVAFVVRASTTILATGGAARLFPISSNPRDITGDGYALAARAGAQLRDMEFIQFYPWRCIDPFDNSRVAIQQSTFSRGGVLLNSEGERFMFRYDPIRGEATSRDIAARGIAAEIRAGRGVRGGVRLDISAMGEAFRQANPIVVRGAESRGLDWRTYGFIVAPEAHFFMGGVSIDEHGRTSVPGLLAAGEVTGGVHGANRLGNNALPETLVFGHRAGLAAASDAARLARDGRSTAGWSPGGGRADGTETEQASRDLRQRMWDDLGVLRTATRIEDGLAFVAELGRRMPSLEPRDPKALRAWLELGFLRDTAELSLTAALARTESRGAHFREDCPDEDPAWERIVVLRHARDGRVSWTTAPVGAGPVPAA